MVDEALNQALAQATAKEILARLGTEHQEAFLLKSMTAALKEWSVQAAIQKAVASRALEVATELVQTKDWTLRIQAAVAAGFSLYLDQLKHATEKMLVEVMHGKEGSYGGGPGVLLKHLKRED